MKLFLVAGLLLCLAGCEKTGYEIILTTDSLSYSDISTMESLLSSKGFVVEGREKEVTFKHYPNEVQSTFLKIIPDKPYGVLVAKLGGPGMSIDF